MRSHLRANGPSKAAGFSLTELLVAMAIGSVVVGTAVVLTGQVQKAFGSQLDGAAVQQEARFAMDWITRTLVSAGSNPDRIQTGGCPAAGTTFRALRRDPNGDNVHNDIRVHSDINPPNGLLGGVLGACNEANEIITIAHNTVTRVITRQDHAVDLAAVQMSDTVITALLFEYFDGNRVVTAFDDSVAWVRVTITARTPNNDPYTGQPLTFTATSDVRLRAR